MRLGAHLREHVALLLRHVGEEAEGARLLDALESGVGLLLHSPGVGGIHPRKLRQSELLELRCRRQAHTTALAARRRLPDRLELLRHGAIFAGIRRSECF